MTIVCKCGHDADDHHVDREICYGEISCMCQYTRSQVYQIHATEQQARLDTNREQVKTLIADKKRLIDLLKVGRRLARHESGCEHIYGGECDCGYDIFVQIVQQDGSIKEIP